MRHPATMSTSGEHRPSAIPERISKFQSRKDISMITTMNNDASAKLTKANISLAVRLSELAHQQNSLLMDSLQKSLSGCYAEFETNAKNALSAGDWISMSTTWATIPLMMMKMQTRQIQQMLEFNAKIQQQTNTILRDAMSNWQKDAALAMQESAGAMPLSTALRNWFDGAALTGTGSVGSVASAAMPSDGSSSQGMTLRMTEPSRVMV